MTQRESPHRLLAPDIHCHAAFTPESIGGMSSDPYLKGQALQDVRLQVTDAAAFQPVEAGVHIAHAFLQQAPDKQAFFAQPDFLAKPAGTARLQQMLLAGATPEAVIAAWLDAGLLHARGPALLRSVGCRFARRGFLHLAPPPFVQGR